MIFDLHNIVHLFMLQFSYCTFIVQKNTDIHNQVNVCISSVFCLFIDAFLEHHSPCKQLISSAEPKDKIPRQGPQKQYGQEAVF